MYVKEGSEYRVSDRREMLRVKVKSLAEEARIIRHEERRTWGVLYNELRKHRVLELRKEARAAHIAYGFVKGRPFMQIEQRPMTNPDWERVKTLYTKYGPIDVAVRDQGLHIIEAVRKHLAYELASHKRMQRKKELQAA